MQSNQPSCLLWYHLFCLVVLFYLFWFLDHSLGNYSFILKGWMTSILLNLVLYPGYDTLVILLKNFDVIKIWWWSILFLPCWFVRMVAIHWWYMIVYLSEMKLVSIWHLLNHHSFYLLTWYSIVIFRTRLFCLSSGWFTPCFCL